jgi:flagellar L-ring protein precursor FlgH
MNSRETKLLLSVLMPMSLFAQMGASPGSLYSPAGHLADSARDLRASQVDDIVTILVSENVSAVASGVTNTSRKSSAQNNITSLAGPVSATGRIANLLGVTNNQQLAGSGTTSRNMTVSTTVSARVVDVSANGTLTVEGTKDIAVNSEKQSIVVRGLVRPADLTTANTVLSTQVANLQVHVNGKGVVGDAIKRPFILYRLLLGLLPF